MELVLLAAAMAEQEQQLALWELEAPMGNLV
jgi:hypothetical protein